MSAYETASDSRPAQERPLPTAGRPVAFKRRLLLFAFLLTLAAPLSAEAYTLVLRSGRRVEISDRFDVTREALVHEVAPGVRVAVRLEHIDIGATERANGEPAGTFLGRIADAPGQSPGAQRPHARTRVVTNKDLEVFRLERLRNEADYERLRAERGLPSMEELRRRDEERDRKFIEEARRIEAEQRRAAEYEALRGELLSLRTQLGALYAPPPQSAYAPSVVYYRRASSLSCSPASAATDFFPADTSAGRPSATTRASGRSRFSATGPPAAPPSSSASARRPDAARRDVDDGPEFPPGP